MGMKRGGGKRFAPVSDLAREVARRRRARERRGLTEEEQRRRAKYQAEDLETEQRQMQEEGNNGDAVCHSCGLAYTGPDRGVMLPTEVPQDMEAAGLKGSHINHGGFCPDCRLGVHEMAVEKYEKRYGPGWRQRLIDAGYDPDTTTGM